MLETGFRQFRLAMGMVWGRRLDPANVARLVEDALATVAEFGEPGLGVRELLEGPFTDPEARTDLANRALRRTARRLADRSPFYARRFAAAGIAPGDIDLETMRALPVTVKRDLVEHQKDFLCTDARPHLATRTTGTTGRPAEIWLSRYELQLWSAMSALTAVLRDEMHPHDLMQVHISSRATASISLTTAVCRLVGARCRLLGVIPPDEALDSLADGATLLSTSASYLAELVVAARRRGLDRSDFGLSRIEVGGEPLSPSLRSAAATTLGGRVNDGFGMTEVIPLAATTCSDGHLHHDLSMGLVELLDLDTAEPARPGALSTVVITPYFPFRECMPVFRYDTRDVVRRLDGQPLTCELAGLPGTGRIVGKADQLLRLGAHDVITPRDLVEAVEALPTEPWPARFAARLEDGRARLSLPAGAVRGLSRAEVRTHFLDRGIDVDVHVVADEQAPSLRHLRSDLRETTFASPPGRGRPAASVGTVRDPSGASRITPEATGGRHAAR